MKDSRESQLATTYGNILFSLTVGLLRLGEAQECSYRLHESVLQFKIAGLTLAPGPYRKILSPIAGIGKIYDSMEYVTNTSYLVYATALMDTFLTDTTLFLLLLHPRSIGGAHQITIDSLLNSSSKNEALTQVARKRSREISFLSFAARLDYLKATYGLGFQIDPSDRSALERYSDIRNSVVHDQGVFELYLDETGTIVSRQKACARRPTPVTADDAWSASHLYAAISRSVARAIAAQVIKAPDHPVFVTLLDPKLDIPFTSDELEELSSMDDMPKELRDRVIQDIVRK